MSRKIEAVPGEPAAVHLEISIEDLFILHGALRETNEALEDWEFELRLGVPRERLLQLMRWLSDQVDKHSPA